MREKKKAKKSANVETISWPTWGVRQSPTPSRLMVCTVCHEPTWTSSTHEGSKRHIENLCNGKLRALTTDEKVQAKAAMEELIGTGKDPVY